MGEALLQGGVPVAAGWFLVSVREARWVHNRTRSACRATRTSWFSAVRAHLLIEGDQRSLGQWDFVHCPPRPPHTIVTTDHPALILAVGALDRRGGARAIRPSGGHRAWRRRARRVDAGNRGVRVVQRATPGPAPNIFA